jgi:dihydroneopterin aldolase
MDRIDAVRQAFFSPPAVTDMAMQQDISGTAPTAQTTPRMDIIFIENFTGNTVIGIDHGELHDPQPVRMDLAIGVPVNRACTTDRIEDTINYASVRSALHRLLATHRVQLLEALAEAVARLLIRDFGAHWVRVALAKPAKFDDVAAVGVLIERARGEDGAQRRAPVSYAMLGEGLIPH